MVACAPPCTLTANSLSTSARIRRDVLLEMPPLNMLRLLGPASKLSSTLNGKKSG